MTTRHPWTVRCAFALLLIMSVGLLTACGGTPTSAVFQNVNSGLKVDDGSVAQAPQNPNTGVAVPAPQSQEAPAPAVPVAPMAPVAAAPTAAPASDAAGAAAPPPAPTAPPSEPLPVLTPAPDVAVNPFTSTAQDPLSTFALDVDTGSYTAARSVIMAGQLPPADTVRVEEFVNYFRYDYPIPEDSAFGITVDGAPSPFTRDTALLRVGIQGYTVAADQRQNAVLTFVVDVSGSMAESNRLPLVKESLKLLVNELKQGDQVGIVVYGSTAHVVLEHTGIDQRERILSAIDSLTNEGSTNAEAGLQLGYQLAAGSFKEGASNRVILCSDGLANVGATGPDAIRASIREQSKKGIYLTTIGVGMGLYNDYLMEQLADDGDGNYAYVNDLAEAQRVFVQNLTGTLQVIARDAKVQVEFDPAVVRQYRLVGYENRAVADADFRNDTVDAGEVGAGHSVTALYEVLLTGQAGNALTVHMRWADPKTSEVREIAQPFASELVAPSFERGSLGFQQAAAVAAFAEVLKGSPYARDLSFGQVRDIADRIAPQMAGNADFQEFAALVARASAFQR